MKKTIIVLLLICLSCGVSFLIAHPGFTINPYSYESLYLSARADSAHGFDVVKYDINLEINNQTHFINGFVIADVIAGQQYNGIDYNLIGLNVSEVRINDTITPYTHQNGILHIDYPANQGQQFTTKVTYSGTPQLSPNLYSIGMIFSSSNVFTISDPDAGRYWWPCYDHPWDKAIVDFHITMRSDWLVACNGLRSSIVDNGNGTKTHNWIGSNPMATYLVCITAGPYLEINQTAGSVPIQNFVTQSQYNNALVDFSTLPAILQFFETQFGTYPFEKYGNAVVTMSTYGAMEHQTMTTLGQQYITGNHSGEITIAHELAHQWFGDCLTPLTFKDVWLSEGFATYSELLWTHKRFGWQSAINYANNSFHQYYISWENSVGPQTIYNPHFNNYFNPQSYEKAASVLHMLRLKIGNANFFQLLQNWFTTYHNSNVVTSEFQAMAEQISGQDLDQFFNQWIYQSGIPSVEYSIFSHQDLGRIKVIAKTTSPTSTQFHLEIPFSYSASQADSLVIKASPDGFVNDLPFDTSIDLSNFMCDPSHWVLAKQHTINRVNLLQCFGANGSVSLNWSAFSGLVPITGYCVWRKLPDDTLWTQINPNLVTGLTYIDNTVTNGMQYLYKVTAADNSGYQSIPSDILTAYPIAFPFDWGFLLVDETKDGAGTATTPNDAMVDDFYAGAISPINYTSWDYATLGAPSINTLSHYPIILWHADDFGQNLIGNNLTTLSYYLVGGGKLIISGWKTPLSFTTEFTDLFMPDITLNFSSPAVLTSALSSVYPTLTPDPDKLNSIWNGLIPMVYTFQNAQNILYTANMLTSADHNGEPAVIRLQSNGTLILFGFPLYYMQDAGVRILLQQLLPELEPSLPVEDNTIPAAKLNLTCSPNPFKDKLNIFLSGKINPQSVIKIYNLKGQLVNTLHIHPNQAEKTALEWTPKDYKGRLLPAGIYLLRYQDYKSTITKKLVLID